MSSHGISTQAKFPVAVKACIKVLVLLKWRRAVADAGWERETQPNNASWRKYAAGCACGKGPRTCCLGYLASRKDSEVLDKLQLHGRGRKCLELFKPVRLWLVKCINNMPFVSGSWEWIHPQPALQPYLDQKDCWLYSKHHLSAAWWTLTFQHSGLCAPWECFSLQSCSTDTPQH